MDIYVENAAELTAALNSASAGDVITLASGDYGSVTITADYADMVTIQSEEPGGAVFDSLKLTNATNITVDGVHVDGTGNGGAGGSFVKISDGSQGITLTNMEINGLVDGVYTGAYGVHVDGSSDVTLNNNYIHDVKIGMLLNGSSDVSVVDNGLDYLGNDGIKFAGMDGLLLEGNIEYGNVFPEEGDHVDFIQGQGADSNDVTIRDNVLLASNVNNIQGISLFDVNYTNVLVEGNVIYSGQTRGITVEFGENVTVINNTVLNIPGTNKSTYIDVVDGGVNEGNIFVNNATTPGEANGNLQLQNDDPDGDFYVDDYFVNGSAGQGITFEDLQIIEGTLAEEYGAVGVVEAVVAVLEGGEPVVPVDPVDPIEIVDPIVVTGSEALDAALDAATGGETISVENGDDGYVIILDDETDDVTLHIETPSEVAEAGTVDLVFSGSDGNDIVFGADGDDVIAGGGGVDRLLGGEGSDTFVFAQGTELDIVYDFADGVDQIGLQDIAFDDLTISDYRNGDTLIQMGDDRLILRDVDFQEITVDDFISL
ncbi:calcium-binding protein [Loktanella sp. D2R18]|uniref:calcium-binding protein n=3 Tax=Rhodobacterales TaxID=204455 RepID=UPI0015F05BEB|nr:right-handed parallel beta-helix repeat-containing protein [Loktanella sp. D2R18]